MRMKLIDSPTRACHVQAQFDGYDLEWQAKMPYDQYLQTEYWQKIRQIKLTEAEWKCSACPETHGLQIHHKSYKYRGREHLKLSTLLVLCDSCHKKVHGLDKPKPPRIIGNLELTPNQAKALAKEMNLERRKKMLSVFARELHRNKCKAPIRAARKKRIRAKRRARK